MLTIRPNGNVDNITMLDFEFKCIKFENNYVELKLNFKNTEYISYGWVRLTQNISS